MSAPESAITGGPPRGLDEMLGRYSEALVDYLAQPGEPGLLAAQSLGVRAIRDGVGLLEMAAIHHEALQTLLLRMLIDESPAGLEAGAGWARLPELRAALRSLTPHESTAAMRAAESFFTTSIGPYELSHRRFQEAAAALNRRNSQLEQQAGRIARTLYDDTLQLLAAVNLCLHQVAGQLPRADLQYLRQAGNYLERIQIQLADFSFELRPYTLDSAGLDGAIRTVAAYVSKMARLDITVDVAPPGPLSWSLATILYRAVEEVLSNICEHAQASRVSIRLASEGELIQCSVRDDGIGFEPSEVFSARGERGLGLIGIRESVGVFGGSLAIQSGPGRGTELHIRARRSPARPAGAGGLLPMVTRG